MMGTYYTVVCHYCEERIGDHNIKHKFTDGHALNVIDFINSHIHCYGGSIDFLTEDFFCYDACECWMSYKISPLKEKRFLYKLDSDNFKLVNEKEYFDSKFVLPERISEAINKRLKEDGDEFFELPDNRGKFK